MALPRTLHLAWRRPWHPRSPGANRFARIIVGREPPVDGELGDINAEKPQIPCRSVWRFGRFRRRWCIRWRPAAILGAGRHVQVRRNGADVEGAARLSVNCSTGTIYKKCCCCSCIECIDPSEELLHLRGAMRLVSARSMPHVGAIWKESLRTNAICTGSSRSSTDKLTINTYACQCVRHNGHNVSRLERQQLVCLRVHVVVRCHVCRDHVEVRQRVDCAEDVEHRLVCHKVCTAIVCCSSMFAQQRLHVREQG